MQIKDKNFLSNHPRVRHGFFGREEGMESAKILAALEMPEAQILRLHQVHGCACISVDMPWPDKEPFPEGDAFVTDKAGLVLAIKTADCAPVLFYGEKAQGAPVVAACHAGWRGAFNGVLENTVQAMEALGASKSTIRAVIGPCIQQASYEVDEDFIRSFCDQSPENDDFFKAAHKAEHFMFDLSGYSARRLAEAGVGHISITGLDTYVDEANYFSFRRATHRHEPDYGRQLNSIVIMS